MPTSTLLYTHFPYCLRRVGAAWLVLNRNYKPIGMSTRDTVAYEGDRSLVRIDHRSIAAIRRAAYRVQDEGGDSETIYFYGGSSVPWRSERDGEAYFARLQPLLKAKALR